MNKSKNQSEKVSAPETRKLSESDYNDIEQFNKERTSKFFAPNESAPSEAVRELDAEITAAHDDWLIASEQGTTSNAAEVVAWEKYDALICERHSAAQEAAQ